MTIVVTIEARPRLAGAPVTVRLAGGGRRRGYHYDGEHWRAGIVTRPKFKASIGFDQNGWSGGTVPQVSAVRWRPWGNAPLDELAAMYWTGAPITLKTRDEDGGPVVTELVGTVAGASVGADGLTLTIADLSVALDRDILSTFAGTGNAEGVAEAAGRTKRRSWGRCFNIEGRILSKIYNIYEFGDPACPMQAIDVVRDKGRAGAPAPVIIAWAGSIEATLSNLAVSAAPQGSAAVAPSIACAKWWTQPAGPLTADLRGEVGTGYVDTAGAIAERIVAAASAYTVANVAEAVAMRDQEAGVHMENQTAAQALDELLLGVSMIWVLQPDGQIILRPITFDDPVETVRIGDVERKAVFPPVKRRTVKYQRNYRQHSDGELVAAPASAVDVVLVDGTTVQQAITTTTEQVNDAHIALLSGLVDAEASRLRDRALQFFGERSEHAAVVMRRETEQRVDADRASAAIFDLLGARSPDGDAFVIDARSVQISPGLALAEAVNSVGATLGGHSASIDTLLSAVVDKVGGLAKAMLVLTVDGYVSSVSITNTGHTSAFRLRVGEVDIETPTGNPIFEYVPAAGITPGYVKMPDVVVEKLTYAALVDQFDGDKQSLAADAGYQILPGGFIVQWGQVRESISVEGTFAVTFPLEFPTAVMAVNATAYLSSYDVQRDLWMQNIGPPTTGGCVFGTQSSTKHSQNIDGFDWMAFGK